MNFLVIMKTCVRDDIVKKPGSRNCSQRAPVALEDEPVWYFSIFHGVLLVTGGLFHG